MHTVRKIRAALAPRQGERMPSEDYRRAALALVNGRALDMSEADFQALAVTLGITDEVAAIEHPSAEGEHPSAPERSPIERTDRGRALADRSPEHPSARQPSGPSAPERSPAEHPSAERSPSTRGAA